MEPFDKMKGKLREESPLPEGFGWEDMQEGIFQKMADRAAPEQVKKRFEFEKLIFFLLGMVTMLGLSVLLHFVNKEQQSLDNNQESISNLATTNQSINPLNEAANSSKGEQLTTESATTPTLNTAENHPTELTNAKTEPIPIGQQLKTTTNSVNEAKVKIKDKATVGKIGNKKTIKINKEDNLQSKAKNRKIATNKTGTKTPKQKNSLSNIEAAERFTKTASPTAFNNNSSLLKRANKHISTQNDKPRWTLNALEKKDFEVLYHSRLSSIHPVSLSNPLVVEKRDNSSRFSMAIGVGFNYWTPNWGNSSASQERAQYEKALIGNTYSLQVGYQLHPNWSIGTGLVQSKYFSKFNFNKTDIYQKVKTGALVEIQINSVTGDSTQIFGDRTINVNRQRQVVHYNTFQKWSVPLIAKYGLRKRKMEYALGIGTMLTLSTKTAGKTINSTIQDYNATSPIYQSGFEIAALGTFDLNYHLSKKYFIGAQLSGIGSLKNWSTENEVVLKPIIFNSQLTIGIKF